MANIFVATRVSLYDARQGEDGVARAIRSKTNDLPVQTDVHHVHAARDLIHFDVHWMRQPTPEKCVRLEGSVQVEALV